MPNDINEALRTLMDAARGRAFFWANPAVVDRGWRLIDRIKIDAAMDTAGETRFSVIAVAADCANLLLASPTEKLVDALIAAHSTLASLPPTAIVPVYSSATLPAPVNDAGPAPAAEVA